MKEKCRDIGLAPTLDNQMAAISGCSFVEESQFVRDGKYWLRLKCERCGEISESWSNQPSI